MDTETGRKQLTNTESQRIWLKTEISIKNSWRKRAEVMILRNDKNENTPSGKWLSR